MLPGLDGALAVDGLAKRTDDAAGHPLAHRHLRDPTGPLDQVPLFDRHNFSQENGPDVILLQIEDHAGDIVGELQQLTRHHLLQAVDPGDPITDLDHGPDLGDLHGRLVPLELLLDELTDLVRANLCHRSLLPEETFPKLPELRAEAAVIDGAIHLDHDPPENGRIDMGCQEHSPSKHLGQLAAKALLEIGREGDRRRKRRLDSSQTLIHQVAVEAGHGRQGLHPVPREEEIQKPSNEGSQGHPL